MMNTMNIDMNTIISENMGLVYSVINKNFFTYKEVYMEEMEQIGMISLFKAISNYDESKGIKLSTLATTIIKNDLYSFVINDIKKYRGVSDGYCTSTNEVFGENETLENLLGDTTDYYSDIQIGDIGSFILTKDEQTQKIVRMLEEGYTYQEIGNYFGFSKQRVGQIIVKLRKEICKKFPTDSELIAMQIIKTKM